MYFEYALGVFGESSFASGKNWSPPHVRPPSGTGEKEISLVSGNPPTEDTAMPRTTWRSRASPIGQIIASTRAIVDTAAHPQAHESSGGGAVTMVSSAGFDNAYMVEGFSG